jgi:hypothetical protein
MDRRQYVTILYFQRLIPRAKGHRIGCMIGVFALSCLALGYGIFLKYNQRKVVSTIDRWKQQIAVDINITGRGTMWPRKSYYHTRLISALAYLNQIPANKPISTPYIISAIIYKLDSNLSWEVSWIEMGCVSKGIQIQFDDGNGIQTLNVPLKPEVYLHYQKTKAQNQLSYKRTYVFSSSTSGKENNDQQSNHDIQLPNTIIDHPVMIRLYDENGPLGDELSCYIITDPSQTRNPDDSSTNDSPSLSSSDLLLKIDK